MKLEFGVDELRNEVEDIRGSLQRMKAVIPQLVVASMARGEVTNSSARRRSQGEEIGSNRQLVWCDAPKPGDPYTQIPCCDTPKSKGSADNSSTRGIFVVAFLYIFFTHIQILIIFYKSLMYNSFTLLHKKYTKTRLL